MKKLLLALIILSSCSTQKIAKTPTRREIKKAMRYSTSEYAIPRQPDYNVFRSYNQK